MFRRCEGEKGTDSPMSDPLSSKQSKGTAPTLQMSYRHQLEYSGEPDFPRAPPEVGAGIIIFGSYSVQGVHQRVVAPNATRMTIRSRPSRSRSPHRRSASMRMVRLTASARRSVAWLRGRRHALGTSLRSADRDSPGSASHLPGRSAIHLDSRCTWQLTFRRHLPLRHWN